MDNQYATRDELNGFGKRLGDLEVSHGKTETMCDVNTQNIEKLITYTNSLLLKVVFVSCVPVLLTVLIQFLIKR